MRILHIMAGAGQGGAEIYTTDVMLALQERGLAQGAVVHPKAPRLEDLHQGGLQLYDSVLSPPFSFWRRVRLNSLIKQEKPDLVHGWMRRAAALIPQTLDVPTLIWLGSKKSIKDCPPHAFFVGVSPEVCTDMIRQGASPAKTFFIPTFPCLKDYSALDRATLDTPFDVPVLLALSRLHPVKGLDVLLHALADLPGVYLWLAGSGPEERQLRALSRQLGLAKRVRFLGWREDRAALLRASDMLVLPSRSEGLSAVILESWMSGTPLVATDCMGPNVLTHGQTALVVPVDDAHALAEAIKRCLGDEALRRHLIATGYDTYSRHYTRKIVTDQFVALYEKILAA
ncbi:MAG: glycosyltransferase [Alphaproteobacteria bacterium]|nr:glycosyltransferase [Alphaproteobacteria bacterium]